MKNFSQSRVKKINEEHLSDISDQQSHDNENFKVKQTNFPKSVKLNKKEQENSQSTHNGESNSDESYYYSNRLVNYISNYMRSSRVYMHLHNFKSQVFNVRQFIIAYFYYNLQNNIRQIEYTKNNINHYNNNLITPTTPFSHNTKEKEIMISLKDRQNRKSLKELSQISNCNELRPKLASTIFNSSSMNESRNMTTTFSALPSNNNLKTNTTNGNMLIKNKPKDEKILNKLVLSAKNANKKTNQIEYNKIIKKNAEVKNFYLSSTNILYDTKSPMTTSQKSPTPIVTPQNSTSPQQITTSSKLNSNIVAEKVNILSNIHAKWMTLVSNGNNVHHAKMPIVKGDELNNAISNSTRNSNKNAVVSQIDSDSDDETSDSNFYFNNRVVLKELNTNYENTRLESESNTSFETTASFSSHNSSHDGDGVDKTGSGSSESTPTDNYLYYQPSSIYGQINYMLYDIPEEENEELDNDYECTITNYDNCSSNDEVLKI